MGLPVSNTLFFLFSLIIAITMIGEGYFVVRMKTPVTPLPSWLLYGLSAVFVGSEKSKQQFIGKTSSRDVRVYAVCDLVFGTMILLSSFVYLFHAVL